MSDDFATPDGWTEDDVQRHMQQGDSSGTYAHEEEVATVDVTDIEEEATA